MRAFQSQGRFFGGAARLSHKAQRNRGGFNRRGDSLGVLRCACAYFVSITQGFNRRGDSLGVLLANRVTSSSFFASFNRRGDSLGVLPATIWSVTSKIPSFNRRGDSLGVLRSLRQRRLCYYQFQSQGRFFGGAAQSRFAIIRQDVTVSIAGAILWGCCTAWVRYCQSFVMTFQSQGRFFGGAARFRASVYWRKLFVSIAGAILWGCC